MMSVYIHVRIAPRTGCGSQSLRSSRRNVRGSRLEAGRAGLTCCAVQPSSRARFGSGRRSHRSIAAIQLPRCTARCCRPRTSLARAAHNAQGRRKRGWWRAARASRAAPCSRAAEHASAAAAVAIDQSMRSSCDAALHGAVGRAHRSLGRRTARKAGASEAGGGPGGPHVMRRAAVQPSALRQQPP